MAISLIDEAVLAGARQYRACAVLGLNTRTLRRWRAADYLADKRKGASRKPCPHALSAQEKAEILVACNSAAYRSLPPSQIVPRLADHGRYLASESSFYRDCASMGSRTGEAEPNCRAVYPNRKRGWQMRRAKCGVGTLHFCQRQCVDSSIVCTWSSTFTVA